LIEANFCYNFGVNLSILSKFKSGSLGLYKKFSQLSLRKKIFIVFAGIILLILLLQVYSNATKKPPYTTARVTKTNISEEITESGSIQASGRVDVFSPTNGIVTQVYVANGASVSEGDDLFSVESSATIQEQQAALSNYLTAQSSLNTAQSNLNVLRASMYEKWDEFRDLATGDEFETGENKPKEKERLESPTFQIAQDEWLAAEKKYKDQQTAVAQGQADVSSKWLLYQATLNATVKAPTSGTIANLAVSNGSAVEAKASLSLTQVAKPSLSIASFTVTEVAIPVSEGDITKIKEGQNAKTELNSVSSKTYDGSVVRVDTLGSSQDGVIRYNAYVALKNPDENIRSGMTADVTIITKEEDQTLSVPNAAVKPYRGGKAVRVPDKNSETGYKFVPIVSGIRGESRTQILKGLNDGDTIIVTLDSEQLRRKGPFEF
jgi:HlyD family secretion protein